MQPEIRQCRKRGKRHAYRYSWSIRNQMDGLGKIQKEEHTIMYSGGDNHTRGVGIMINKNINKAVLGYWPVSDRIIMMKIQGKPFNIAIVQVYAPTSASTDDEIDEFYNLLESTIDQVKSNEVLVVMGDLNAKVGQ